MNWKRRTISKYKESSMDASDLLLSTSHGWKFCINVFSMYFIIFHLLQILYFVLYISYISVSNENKLNIILLIDYKELLFSFSRQCEVFTESWDTISISFFLHTFARLKDIVTRYWKTSNFFISLSFNLWLLRSHFNFIFLI